jgi:integrase
MGEDMATAEPEPWNRAVGDISAEQRKENESRILDFLWWMKRQGYADETIRGYVLALKVLVSRGADLSSPESVKEVIAKQRWSGNRRKNVINTYSLFLKMHGRHWEKPRCDVEQKIPFIPTEQELDALIAGSGKKLAAYLQLLKETAMRAGEAVKLEWMDVDFERRVVTLNRPAHHRGDGG